MYTHRKDFPRPPWQATLCTYTCTHAYVHYTYMYTGVYYYSQPAGRQAGRQAGVWERLLSHEYCSIVKDNVNHMTETVSNNH